MSHATHQHLCFCTNHCGQEQYNVNTHLGGLSEFAVSAQMVPTIPNLSLWGKSFLRMWFSFSSYWKQLLFSCSLHSGGLGTHFILVSVVGLQKYSTERIYLLPGGCWVPPELLTLVTIFIRFYMSSLVSQVTLNKGPHLLDLDVEPRRLLGCALMALSLLGSLVMNFSYEREYTFYICCHFPDGLLWFSFNLLSRAMHKTNFRHFNSSRFYFTVSSKKFNSYRLKIK